MTNDKAIGTFSLEGEQAQTLLRPASRRKRAVSLADGIHPMPIDDLGFILLHRKSMESRVWQDPLLWYVWSWCLLRASWKERWISIQVGTHTTQVKLLSGQFFFGRHSAAHDLHMKPSSVRNRMARLKKYGNLDIQEDSHGSIITIVNWRVYQQLIKPSGQPEGQQEDSRRTAVGQPQDTNNKGNAFVKGVEGTIPPPEADAPKEPPKEKSLHTKTVEYFCGCWEKLYAAKYPFATKDAAHVKKILDTVKEPIRVKGTIDAYLACREEWYTQDHHSLGKLVCNLAKFVPVGNTVTPTNPKTPPSKYAYMPTNDEVAARKAGQI